jgi:choline dehydrogenase-like flavoprotein
MAEEERARRLATLHALCDTYIPATRPPRGAPDLGGFWRRTASDLGTHERVLEHVNTRVAEPDRGGLMELIDVLGRLRFARLPAPAREQTLRGLRRVSDDAARGVEALRILTTIYFYGWPADGGPNPNWAVSGYPGPPDVEVLAERSIEPFVPAGDPPYTMECDVCVVGSGSGGGVVAGVLAGSGLDVVVLEAGGHYEEADFPTNELDAYREMFWRGGPLPTQDGNVTLYAGATLGGGSTVNWATCEPPPPWVREEWAHEHGLEGVDGWDFDASLRAVSDRISVNARCSDLNDPNQRLLEGAEALGWARHQTRRNVDPKTYEPETAGHVGFGDRTGSKQGVLRTYLADAVGAGTRIVARCRAERILVEDSRAAGVVATWTKVGSATHPLTVRARQVVVAAGAMETAALLLRSGIGGPAVGRNLHVQTVPALVGVYEEEQRPWWGPPQSVVVDEFADLTGGHGFIVEVPHFLPAAAMAALPWRTGRDHKVMAGRSGRMVFFISVLRDRGSGRVTLDDRAEPVVTYPLEDPLDGLHRREALGAMARIHEAAGAWAIIDLSPPAPIWRRGEDLDTYVAGLGEIPSGAGGRILFSAHQMGTARMGTDPQTSVADLWGQLHDVPGVWIGDTSAFPTSLGAHPMLTCMALAHRTALVVLGEER